MTNTQRFYGWWITVAAFITFGLSVGVPYYNNPFFYDYYTKSVEQGGFGWTRDQVLLGFPLASLFTLWVGPVLVHRFSPRKLILAGTGLTCLAYLGWSRMTGDLTVYYTLWFIYTVGYILSGPIAHQVIVSQWFKRKRGTSMGIVYVGVGLFGSLGSLLVKPLAESYGFQATLMILGFLVLLAWPVAIFVLKDRPADIGQNPDGDASPPAETKVEPQPFMNLLRAPAFWLLLIGSFCSIGSIGSVNGHMKFVFKDQGFTDQTELNSVWRTASVLILWSSIFGRLFVGWAADKFSKKIVMVITYVLVAGTIPLMLLVTPSSPEWVYVFAVLFGFGMGADYMLIPLMAAEQFGVNTLARAMAIILPTDTIGQTWFPYGISLLRQSWGSYNSALMVLFGLAAIGAAAIALLPRQRRNDETLPVQGTVGAAARR